MFYIKLLNPHPKTSFVTRLGDVFHSGTVKVARNLLLVLALLSPAVAGAQTVTITSGLSTYVGFTNTTVTMTGQCGLVVTGTNNPISGSTINLNSSNAWFFLPNFRPSVVSASYLSQVKVNGATAAAGSNCRVDQYLSGAVIIPQAPSFTPLQVFSGPNFLGISTNFGIYTYCTNAALGPLWWNISSFILKRGYSATFAQNADGTGASKVYVAQDGDLLVGIMPTNLDHQCSFVRVFPWRWTGKKGWGGTADSTAAMVNPVWSYDWGNGATSTTDTEYVPMQWGGGYTTGINGTQKSTEVLGYNEPDSTAQANLTVAQAISYWPYMMQSGLRLGAPAVSDSGVTGQGVSWLYSFMSQATNLGYRVDFVPVHSYKCNYTAAQLSNYLAGIYQTVGRPIWLTEFNYGADWCSPDDDTSQAVEAANITSNVSMLESCPFIERYAIYQWFGTNRAMVVNGALTPGGVVYANQQSAMAYTQTLPTGGSRSIAEYEFEGSTLDSSGYANHGLATGIPSYTTGHTGQAVALDGTNSFIRLPPNIANSASFTFAAWVYWNGGAQWQRIFDFGDDTSHYLFLTPDSGSSTLRFAINNGSGEQIIETTALPSGSWQHVAVTLSGSSVKLYTNGVLAASSSSFTITPSSFNPNLNYLGKSQFAADPLFHGNLDEVQIADFAFSAAQIAALQTNAPPQFTTNILSGGSATQLVAYSGSIAGAATDPNPGGTLTYTKAGGPAWLFVGTDGTLSGTPGMTDGGTNNFTVRATDSSGESAYALLTITIPFATGNGIWYADTSGSWSDTTKWARACPANGAGLTADFTTVNLSANRTVILDSSRSIGTLKFADYWNTLTWSLTAGINSILTLDTGSVTSPAIIVGTAPTLSSSNVVTISAPLAGTNGFTKSGWGTLILTGGNALSGTLNVDSGSTVTNDGAVRIGSANAGTNLTAINIRNNNSGSSTLQLAGGASVAAPISLSGRNTSIAAIENVSGSNLLSGAITIGVGGGNYIFQSDTNTLNLGGIISSAAGGTRNFTFQGAGDHFISGSLQNGSATMNVIKQDAGNLILANTNPFTGGLSVGGGSVKINYPGTLQNNLVNLDCAGSNALKFGPVTGAILAGLSGINDVWLTNASLVAVTLTNGNNNVSSEFAGAFKGSGSLIKIGSGTFTLDTTNAYTGATTVAGGTLRFSSATNFIASLQPVLWLSFDQAGSGIVTNQGKGGWAMNGTIIGSGAYITNAGRFGNALYINGTGGNAPTNIVLINSKVVDTSASSSWTLGYWLKTTTAGAVVMYQGDGSWSSSGQTTYYLNANSSTTIGSAAGAVRYGGGFLTGTTTVGDGNWHFITLVDSAGAESIYVDGSLDAVTSTMTLALASDANQTWLGGAPDTDASAVKMTGLIDELCLFDRALTQAQIRSLITNSPSSGRLPFASPVSVAAGATLDLSGFSQTLASLSDVNGSGGSVVNGSSTPVTLTLSNSANTVVSFSGSINDAANGTISLLKSGNTTQSLNGSNSYRGTTTISNGTLLVNGSLGSNSVAVQGGTLGGNGLIPGAVTIYPAGTLAPGNNAIGTLSFGSSLTLNGTTYVELDKGSATNDQLRVTGTVNYGGTLTVVNLTGFPTAGDSFPIFQAASYNGTFATINLPALGTGLAWNTNSLTNGIVSVMATVPPQFTPLGAITQTSDGNFQLGGSGAAGETYTLNAATNLSLPIFWFFVTNAVADQNGNFQFWDLSATNFPQKFYRITGSQ